MSLKMAFIAALWAHEKLQGGRRINKQGKIFTVLDVSSQGQIDGKCSVWGWQPLNDLFTRPASWNSACRELQGDVQGFGGSILPWQQQELQVFPPSRCRESSSSQRGSSRPHSRRSYAAFHSWPRLTSIYCFFGSQLMLLGCRSTSQDGFFHRERSREWRTTSYGQSVALGRFILN